MISLNKIILYGKNMSQKKTNNNIKIWKGIKITKNAEKQILRLIKKNKKCIGIKIDIKKSGCAGLKYILTLAYFKKDSEIIFNYKEIDFFIPIKWKKILKNTKIDFLKNGLNHNFTFYNSKNRYLCGCGESFNII